MIYRILPPEEYNKLVGRGWFKEDALPLPTTSVVAVAETEGGDIVGYWCAQAVVHMEPVWTSPEHRGLGLTGINLLKTLVDELHERETRHVFCMADREDLSAMLIKLGFVPLSGMTIFEGAI